MRSSIPLDDGDGFGTVGFYLRHIQDKLAEGGSYCRNRYAKKTRLKDYPFDRNGASPTPPWPRFIDENPHHELVAAEPSVER
jgi:hypothetical protein